MGLRVAILCGLWLLAGVALITGGRTDFVIADDAYYYFEIARNAALGQGFTFDGRSPTNGFHPLWAWSLVPVFKVLPNHDWLPIHIAQAMSLLCLATAAWLLFRLFDRHGAPVSGSFAAAALLLNPFSASLVFRGMEAPLCVLALMVSISVFDAVHRNGRYGLRELGLLGASAGFVFLARTDGFLWAGTLAAVLARDRLRGKGLRSAATRLAGFTAGAAVVASPWILWNLVAFGTVAQTSATAKRMFHLYGRLPQIAPAGVHDAGDVATALIGAARNVLLIGESSFRFAAMEEWVGPTGKTYGLVAAAAAYATVLAGCAWVFRRRHAAEHPGSRSLVRSIGTTLVLFLFVHFFVYAWGFGSYANWYFLVPVLVACIASGAVFAWIPPAKRGWNRALFWLHAGLLAAASWHFAGRYFEPRPARSDSDLQWLGRVLAPGTRVGAWNAGEVGYFFSFHFPDRPVVNLDGVVNNELTRAARIGHYEEYVLDHVDVVVEPMVRLGTILGKDGADAFIAKHVRHRGNAGRRPVSDLIR